MRSRSIAASRERWSRRRSTVAHGRGRRRATRRRRRRVSEHRRCAALLAGRAHRRGHPRVGVTASGGPSRDRRRSSGPGRSSTRRALPVELPARGRRAALADGRRIRPDVVIAATGYRMGLEPLVGHLGVLLPSGKPARRGEPTAAPGLHFNGYWLPMSGELPAMRRTTRRIGAESLDAEAVEHVLVAAPAVARTRTLRSRWTLAPSSASSERRAAVPISSTLAPALPIRIPFWDSVSAQISARTVTRPSSRVGDLPDLDLDRVRDLLAGPVQHLLADQLGQQQLARLVAVLLRRIHVGALRHQLAEPLDQRRQALAASGADREDLVDALHLGRVGEHRDQLVRAQPVGLVDGADHRQLGAGVEQRPDDEAVARPRPPPRR